MATHNSHDSIESVLTEGFIVGESDGSWCDVYPLFATKKLHVGRDGHNDIVVPDLRCSREHCLFRKLNGSWFICDLGSSNGTFVNGVRIERLQKLKPGDRVRVGSQRLLYAATVVNSTDVVADFASGHGSVLL